MDEQTEASKKLRDSTVKQWSAHDEVADTVRPDLLVDVDQTRAEMLAAKALYEDAVKAHQGADNALRSHDRAKKRQEGRYRVVIHENEHPQRAQTLRILEETFQETRNADGMTHESIKARVQYLSGCIREITQGGLDRLEWDDCERRLNRMLSKIPELQRRKVG